MDSLLKYIGNNYADYGYLEASFSPWQENPQPEKQEFFLFLRDPQTIEILKEMGFSARTEKDKVFISWFFSTRPLGKEVLALRDRTENWRQKTLKEIARLKELMAQNCF